MTFREAAKLAPALLEALPRADLAREFARFRPLAVELHAAHAVRKAEAAMKARVKGTPLERFVERLSNDPTGFLLLLQNEARAAYVAHPERYWRASAETAAERETDPFALALLQCLGALQRHRAPEPFRSGRGDPETQALLDQLMRAAAASRPETASGGRAGIRRFSRRQAKPTCDFDLRRGMTIYELSQAAGVTREALQRFFRRYKGKLPHGRAAARLYPPEIVIAVIREMLTNPKWCATHLRRDRLGLILANGLFDNDVFWQLLRELTDIVDKVSSGDLRFRELLLAAGEISRDFDVLGNAQIEDLIRRCSGAVPATDSPSGNAPP